MNKNMIIVRFKVKCKSDKSDQLKAAFQEVIIASRPLEGVISFDIGSEDINRMVYKILMDVFKIVFGDAGIGVKKDQIGDW